MSYFDDTPLSSLNDILIYLYKTLSEGSYSVAIGGISEERKKISYYWKNLNKRITHHKNIKPHF